MITLMKWARGTLYLLLLVYFALYYSVPQYKLFGLGGILQWKGYLLWEVIVVGGYGHGTREVMVMGDYCRGRSFCAVCYEVVFLRNVNLCFYL